MRLYLDSNVFDHVVSTGEQEDLRSWLRSLGAEVLLSDEHLHEAAPIRDVSKRKSMLRLMASLPRLYLRPGAYLHAEEVLGEIRRARKDWLLTHPDTSRIPVFLNLSKRCWSLAKRDPDGLAQIFADNYRPVAETGIASGKDGQKSLRQALVNGADMMEGFSIGGRFIATPQARLDDLEWWWRRDCLTVWHQALFKRPGVMRDYWDYLGPYLRPRLDIDEFIDFWLVQVAPERMRRNAIVSLVGRRQLDQRITHGNAVDSLHATYLLDADYFITADQGFFRALQLGQETCTESATPLLIDRGSSSAVAEIRRVLGQV